MLDFIATTVPTLQVYTISKTDFPEDLVFPPTEEQVAFYSLQVLYVVRACMQVPYVGHLTAMVLEVLSS